MTTLRSFMQGLLSRLRVLCLICMACCCLVACNNKKQPELSGAEVNRVLKEMTEIMVHDITNPPLATRFFAYACLSGYEVIALQTNRYPSMHGRVNAFPVITKPAVDEEINYSLAAAVAMMETAMKMQPSGKLLEQYETALLDSCIRAGWDADVVAASKKFAQGVSQQVLAYARGDNYNKISNLTRYTPLTGDGYWFPTPPGYIAAVEPYFNTVRPFFLDSATQFKTAPPVAYDPGKSSAFYKMTEAVYKEGVALPDDHREIAAFWDCNPFAMQDQGHLQFGFKKISPGAHWLGITGIALQIARKNFNESMRINTIVAMGLMDSFISCWDEKFRSNRIRPESAIRKLIDPQWTPLLQTPPFPEYLSGHSCISSTSATILTRLLGDNFLYRDSIEVSYGLPPRNFRSFRQAAEEAAISRFYGGIHFPDAIENGLTQGEKVGELVLQKLKYTGGSK